jgi:hypothetical protein
MHILDELYSRIPSLLLGRKGSQQTFTGPYTEPEESSLHPSIQYFKNNFNNIMQHALYLDLPIGSAQEELVTNMARNYRDSGCSYIVVRIEGSRL